MTIHPRLLSRQDHTQNTTTAFAGTTDSFGNASKLRDACSLDWGNLSRLLSQFAAFLSALLPTSAQQLQCPGVGPSPRPRSLPAPESASRTGLCSPFALSSLCPFYLSFSCTGSFVGLSTCGAHRFPTDTVRCLCSTSLFPDRLTSLFWTATHYTVLCCVPALFSAVCIFIVQCTASGLVYYTSNPALNRESFASSRIYLLRSSPGEVSLESIREVMNSDSAL